MGFHWKIFFEKLQKLTVILVSVACISSCAGQMVIVIHDQFTNQEVVETREDFSTYTYYENIWGDSEMVSRPVLYFFFSFLWIIPIPLTWITGKTVFWLFKKEGNFL